jgi:hypothetical protein
MADHYFGGLCAALDLILCILTISSSVASSVRRPWQKRDGAGFPSHLVFPVYICSIQSNRTFAHLDSGAQGMKTTSAVLAVVAATLAVSAVHAQVLERPFPQIEKKVSRHL